MSLELLERALALHNAGHLTDAKALYLQAIQAAPGDAKALELLGTLECQAGNWPEGITHLQRSLALDFEQPEVHYNLGLALWNLQRVEEALPCLDRAVSMSPALAPAWHAKGCALHRLGKFAEAAQCFRHVLELRPDALSANADLGAALVGGGQYAEAVEVLDIALRVAPDGAHIWFERGNALIEMRHYSAALDSFDRVIALKADHAEAHCNRGNALAALGHFEEALLAYARSIAINPDLVQAYGNRAILLQQLKRIPEAVEDLDKVLRLEPAYPCMLGQALHARMLVADWRDFSELSAQLEAGIAGGQLSSPPFPVQPAIDSLHIQRLTAETYSRRYFPAAAPAPQLAPGTDHKRVRIGYFSSDFTNHPVAHLIAGVLEHHDRKRFEIFAFSLARVDDPWTKRIEQAVDRFFPVAEHSDQGIASLARDLKLDIAVDLNGWTMGARTEIFARRVAPVQVNYLGFLGTMGSPFMDYIIADEVVIPAELRTFYSERIAYLPCFQINDDKQVATQREFTRDELGLPEDVFVFACFNQVFKITPEVFDAWMRILAGTPGSVLWLFGQNAVASQNLRREADRRGIDPKRLVFAEWLPLEDHLARQGMADLVLDTFPYGGGASASSALRMGIPVLAQVGETFPARMGASLLHAVGLPDMGVASPQAYVQKAIELATSPELLDTIKGKLRTNLTNSPLFNTAAGCTNLEKAFSAMADRHRRGLKPDHILMADEP